MVLDCREAPTETALIQASLQLQIFFADGDDAWYFEWGLSMVRQKVSKVERFNIEQWGWPTISPFSWSECAKYLKFILFLRLKSWKNTNLICFPRQIPQDSRFKIQTWKFLEFFIFYSRIFIFHKTKEKLSPKQKKKHQNLQTHWLYNFLKS